jgi:tyrosinase
MLIYVENLIDFPIPYWNVFDTDLSDPTSPYAGIPQIFIDKTFVDLDGQTKPNPLRFAMSFNGLNKTGGQCVLRNPNLSDGPPPAGQDRTQWNAEINRFSNQTGGYHAEIINAMNMNSFSSSQSDLWGGSTEFFVVTEDMPDSLYTAENTFDGWFEQVHDNIHGWSGGTLGDMVGLHIIHKYPKANRTL